MFLKSCQAKHSKRRVRQCSVSRTPRPLLFRVLLKNQFLLCNLLHNVRLAFYMLMFSAYPCQSTVGNLQTMFHNNMATALCLSVPHHRAVGWNAGHVPLMCVGEQRSYLPTHFSLEAHLSWSLSKRNEEADYISSPMRCHVDQREVGTVAQGPAEAICNVRHSGHQWRCWC